MKTHDVRQTQRRRLCWRVLLLPLIVASSSWVSVRGQELQVLLARQVLAMDGQRVATLPDTDAVVVANGRIQFVGQRTALPEAYAAAPRQELGERVLMAGFVDAHSHFPVVGLARLGVDLVPSPAGDIDSLPALYSAVEQALDETPENRWVLGFDYDESGMREAAHPDRDALDAIAPDRPVWLRHRSGHMGVGNTSALDALGVTREGWQVPDGGRAIRDEQGRLTGLLQETAAPSLSRLLREVPGLQILNSLRQAGADYLSVGVTTAQNGYATAPAALALWFGVNTGFVQPNVVVWPRAADDSGVLDRIIRRIASLDQRFTVGAYKLIADGSPQGMTAHLTRAYPAASGRDPSYRGVPVLSAERLQTLVSRYHERGQRLAIHTNGDAAIDAALDAIGAALEQHPRQDHRHLLVHAQTVRDDQLQRMSSLGVGASFFQNHVLHWGDWHLTRSLGPERAERISPLASADTFGVDWTLHADTPVTPMRPFELMESAERRLTRQGRVLGPEQRVDRGRALAALTYWPAWQAGLESDRGDVRPGLRADLIALNANPLTVSDVASLKVEAVWLGGRAVR